VRGPEVYIIKNTLFGALWGKKVREYTRTRGFYRAEQSKCGFKEEIMSRVKITAYVSADVAKAVEGIALQKKLSISAVASEMLDRAASVEASDWGDLIILPTLERKIEIGINHGFKSLRGMLFRILVEAGTSRQMAAQTYADLIKDGPVASRVHQDHFEGCVRRFKKSYVTPDVAEDTALENVQTEMPPLEGVVES
jgi:hypothetical protein